MHRSIRFATFLTSLCAFAMATPGCASGHGHASTSEVSGADARTRLAEGNLRFVRGHSKHPRQDVDRRIELVSGQQPFAAIVGCSDSRVAPEVVFDQGLGDLFIVRVAGNVLDDHAIGSVEYAAEHLHAGFIVVLGHSKCGAINATRDLVASHGHAEGHIESLVNAIRPAVEQTMGQDSEATTKANVRIAVRELRTSEPILHHMAAVGEIIVIGAYYDLDTGLVEFLDE